MFLSGQSHLGVDEFVRLFLQPQVYPASSEYSFHIPHPPPPSADCRCPIHSPYGHYQAPAYPSDPYYYYPEHYSTDPSHSTIPESSTQEEQLDYPADQMDDQEEFVEEEQEEEEDKFWEEDSQSDQETNNQSDSQPFQQDKWASEDELMVEFNFSAIKTFPALSANPFSSPKVNERKLFVLHLIPLPLITNVSKDWRWDTLWSVVWETHRSSNIARGKFGNFTFLSTIQAKIFYGF